jgi:hypothetical protein
MRNDERNTEPELATPVDDLLEERRGKSARGDSVALQSGEPVTLRS